MTKTARGNQLIPLDNPYPWYEKVRKDTPILKLANSQWLITRYSDVNHLLMHPDCSHWGQDPQTQAFMSPTQRAIAKTLHSLSPNSQKPYRKHILHQLAARSLQVEESSIVSEANRLLDILRSHSEIDFIADYAHKFTFATIARILGIPSTEIEKFTNIAGKLDGSYINQIDGTFDTEDSKRFIEYLKNFIERKKIEPENDLTSGLLQLCNNEDEEDEFILSLIILLFYAGHQNMMNFLGNAIIALSKDMPFQQQIRNEKDAGIPSVDELLRFDSPLQFIIMYAKQRIEMDQVTIPLGSQLLISVGSANRDPLVYKNPDTLQLGRKEPNLSFGSGAFRCIGARLAQMQALVGIQRFLQVTRSFSLQEKDIIWRTTPLVQRGPKILPIKTEWL
jgi:cytochrome P450